MVAMKLLMFSIWIANIVQSWLSEREAASLLDTSRYSAGFRFLTTNFRHLKIRNPALTSIEGVCYELVFSISNQDIFQNAL